jgi:hypothetical protein
MKPVEFLAILLILTGWVGVGVTAWSLFSRSARLLDQWAQAHRYEILVRQFCWAFKGPFTWNCFNGQTVYRVVVEDRDGEMRAGYVKLGSPWWGVWGDGVAEAWDESAGRGQSEKVTSE